MELNILELKDHKIAEVISDEIVINNARDALDLMASAGYYGARSLILGETNLSPEFFDLRTRVAGEILQKFSNYRIKLAIIGEFERYESKSLKAFIRESNRGNQIFFVPDRDTAITKIVG
jgi:hypothetical protein